MLELRGSAESGRSPAAMEPGGSTLKRHSYPDERIVGLPGNPHLRQLVDMPTTGSRQVFEQCLGLFQIGRVKSLGEPAVDGRQQVTPFVSPALFAPQPGQTRGGAQLP